MTKDDVYAHFENPPPGSSGNYPSVVDFAAAIPGTAPDGWPSEIAPIGALFGATSVRIFDDFSGNSEGVLPPGEFISRRKIGAYVRTFLEGDPHDTDVTHAAAYEVRQPPEAVVLSYVGRADAVPSIVDCRILYGVLQAGPGPEAPGVYFEHYRTFPYRTQVGPITDASIWSVHYFDMLIRRPGEPLERRPIYQESYTFGETRRTNRQFRKYGAFRAQLLFDFDRPTRSMTVSGFVESVFGAFDINAEPGRTTDFPILEEVEVPAFGRWVSTWGADLSGPGNTRGDVSLDTYEHAFFEQITDEQQRLARIRQIQRGDRHRMGRGKGGLGNGGVRMAGGGYR